MNYKVLDFQKYARLVVLKYFENNKVSVFLTSGFEHIALQLDWLHGNGYLDLNADNNYVINSTGEKYLATAADERLKLIQKYDIYSGVDLSEGVFAFAEYGKFNSITEFQAYLMQERFSDLRLEIIEYENDGLPESVIAERIFDLVFAVNFDKIDWFANTDWQYELLVTSFEVLEAVVAGSPSWKDYGDDEEAAKGIFQDIRAQGESLKEELRFG